VVHGFQVSLDVSYARAARMVEVPGTMNKGFQFRGKIDADEVNADDQVSPSWDREEGRPSGDVGEEQAQDNALTNSHAHTGRLVGVGVLDAELRDRALRAASARGLDGAGGLAASHRNLREGELSQTDVVLGDSTRGLWTSPLPPPPSFQHPLRSESAPWSGQTDPGSNQILNTGAMCSSSSGTTNPSTTPSAQDLSADVSLESGGKGYARWGPPGTQETSVIGRGGQVPVEAATGEVKEGSVCSSAPETAEAKKPGDLGYWQVLLLFLLWYPSANAHAGVLVCKKLTLGHTHACADESSTSRYSLRHRPRSCQIFTTSPSTNQGGGRRTGRGNLVHAASETARGLAFEGAGASISPCAFSLVFELPVRGCVCMCVRTLSPVSLRLIAPSPSSTRPPPPFSHSDIRSELRVDEYPFKHSETGGEAGHGGGRAERK
jgi:hypothetical protein